MFHSNSCRVGTWVAWVAAWAAAWVAAEEEVQEVQEQSNTCGGGFGYIWIRTPAIGNHHGAWSLSLEPKSDSS